MVGSVWILIQGDILEEEKAARLKHLLDIMILVMNYNWLAVRALYGVALRELEKGHRQWSDSLQDLKDEMLKPTDVLSISFARPAPKESFCKAYNWGREGCTRGDSCTYLHVCEDCAKKRGKKDEPHRGKLCLHRVDKEPSASKKLVSFGPIPPGGGGQSGVAAPLPPLDCYSSSPLALDYVISMHNRVRASGLFNFKGLRLPVPTPLKVANFPMLLSGYWDYMLCDHIQFGFPINYIREELPLVPHAMHKSALDHPTSVGNYINKLISRGSVIGPLQVNPFNSLLVIPVQTVDNSGSVDRRVVFDVSYLKTGTSVTDGVPKDALHIWESHTT